MTIKIDSNLNLPKQYKTWRDDQWATLSAIQKSDKSFFLADLPTGVGKSLIAVGAHKILNKKTIIICATKQLQNQYLRDFEDIAVTLKGRANYPCAMRKSEFPDVTCEDCSMKMPRKCRYFSECEYYQQKEKAAAAPLAILNNAYFLNEVNGFNSVFAGAELLIADEIDALDNTLLGYVELRVNSRQLDRYGLSTPYQPWFKESWVKWIDKANETLTRTSGDLGRNLERRSFEDWGKPEMDANKRKKAVEKLKDKLTFIKSEVDYTWTFTQEVKDGQTEWVFKPINVGKYANRYLWSQANMKIGLSGTILSPQILCRELGISDCDYMRLSSPFDVGNRPIYYNPVASFSHNHMAEELPKLKKQIEMDLKGYEDKKVLIHTVSYQLRDYLRDNLECQDRIVTHDSNDREQALEHFKKSRKPLVILSPSFDRGVDLRAEDNCGAQMICKIPYLSLGDQQVSAKTKTPGGWEWYDLKACQTLLQMSGRSVRSATQRCDTFIYDEKFSRLRSRTKGTIPEWWLAAVQPAKSKIQKAMFSI